MAYFSSITTLFLLALVSSGQVLAAACPASSDTTTAANGNCTITGSASTITLNFNSGFDSTTAISAIDGNNGTTVGAQRKLSFIKAAEIISVQVTSSITLVVDASFSALTCDTSTAVLGSAGASANLGHNTGAPSGISNKTFYPIGLYNAITGGDASAGINDVAASFNSNIGNSGCLQASNGWYYGFSSPASNYIGFTTVLLHEITHGLGFASLTDPSTGAKTQSGGTDFDDVFSNNLYDKTNSRNWNDASESNANRASSATSTTGLLWSGTHVNAQAIGLLTNGFDDADSDGAFESGDKIEMYAPSSVESGSSVSHFSTDAAPNELMEPSYTDSLYTLGLSLYLLKDIGWSIATNTAPTITAVNQTTDEDTGIVVDISSWGTDADGDTKTYSVVSCAANITCSVSGTNLTLTPASNHNGATHSITVQVSDGNSGTASDSFNLTVSAVNDAPTISAVNQSTPEDTALTGINASGWGGDVDSGDTLSYSINSNCHASVTCSINSDGTNLSLTPAANFNGSATGITINVSDDNGSPLTNSATFTLTVSSVNDNPTITAVNQSTTEDNAINVDISSWGSDTENDSLTYTVFSCPANITCSISSSTLTLLPSNNYNNATNSITIEVDDDNSGTAITSSFNFNVTPVNDAPTISAVNQSTTEGTALTGIDASGWGGDVDTGDTLSYSVSSNCHASVTCSINSDGTNLSLTPAANFNGTATGITINVSDDNGSPLTNSATFTLTVSAVNNIPSITGVNQSTTEDTAKVIDMNALAWASDADNDTLTYSVTSCPSNITCAVSGTHDSVLTLTPASNHNGSTHSITVNVSDGNGGAASDSFNLSITPVNDAPTISAVNQSTTEGIALTGIDASGWASDVDTGDTLSYSVSSNCHASVTCSISSDGTNLSLTPAANFNGTAAGITINVSDDNGSPLTNSATFTLTVSAPTSNLPSTHVDVNDTLFNHGDSLDLNLDDGQIDVLGGSGDYTYGLEFNSTDVSALITSNASGINVSLPQSGVFAGTYTLTITDNSNGEITILSITRPLRLTFSSERLLNSDASQTLKIEGGAVGSQYLVEELSSSLLIFSDAADQLQTTFIATNDNDNFNQAIVHLDSVNVAQLTAIDISVSSLNTGYENENRTITLVPAIEHRFTVMDTSGNAITLASANLVSHLNLTQLNIQTTFTSDANGQFSFWLPNDDQFYGLNITANGFISNDSTLGASLTDHEITLTLMSNAIVLSASLSALGTQDFTRDNPTANLHFSDGSSEAILVTVNNASQASFEHPVDLNLRSLSTLQIEQVDSLSFEIDISQTTQNQSYNILLERSVAIVISTPTPKESSGFGPLDARFMLLLLLLCLIGRRTQNRQR
jgi:GH25 family lysozyme M1 (1,4-beta-N-acetylmuramidase)